MIGQWFIMTNRHFDLSQTPEAIISKTAKRQMVMPTG